MYSGYLCKFDFDETQNKHKNARTFHVGIHLTQNIHLIIQKYSQKVL